MTAQWPGLVAIRAAEAAERGGQPGGMSRQLWQAAWPRLTSQPSPALLVWLLPLLRLVRSSELGWVPLNRPWL